MSATMDRLSQENPNVHQQMNEWQIARTQNNEDAYDWSQFRDHAKNMGSADPGEEEPEEFRQYDWTQHRRD